MMRQFSCTSPPVFGAGACSANTSACSRTRALDELLETPQRIEVLVERAVTRTHRVELDARHPHLSERFDSAPPLLGTALRRRKPSLDGHLRGIASFFLDQATESFHSRAAFVVRWHVGEPAVGDPCDTPHDGLDDRTLLSVPATTQPDRDRSLYWERTQAGAIDAMPATAQVHDLLRPARAQNGDLLLDAPASIRDALTTCLVLHPIPADADAENDAAAREDVDLCGLFRHQRRLPLRQDDHRGRELQACCYRGEIPVQDERLVEHRAVVVDAGPASGSIGVRPEDVIEDHEMVVAELLDRSRVGGDSVGIGADLELRQDRADLHPQGFEMLTGTPMPLTRTSAPPARCRA